MKRLAVFAGILLALAVAFKLLAYKWDEMLFPLNVRLEAGVVASLFFVAWMAAGISWRNGRGRNERTILNAGLCLVSLQWQALECALTT